MAVIRNCEQYVLARLEELERENATLKAGNDYMKQVVADKTAYFDSRVAVLKDRQDRLKEIIQKYAVVKSFESTKGDTNQYIDMDIDGWRADNKADFDFVMRFAHVKTEEQKLAEEKGE